MRCHVRDCKADAVYSDGAHHPDGYAVPTCESHNKGSDAPIGRVCPLNVRPRLDNAVCNCPKARRDARRYAIVDGAAIHVTGPIVGSKITLPAERFGGFAIQGDYEVVPLDEFEQQLVAL